MSFGKQVQRGSLALVVLAALLASSAAQAVGPRPVLQMPVSCGQTWDASTYDGHWPDEDSIDLAQRDGDGDNISAGEPVLASADGTVMAVFTTTPVDSNADGDVQWRRRLHRWREPRVPRPRWLGHLLHPSRDGAAAPSRRRRRSG